MTETSTEDLVRQVVTEAIQHAALGIIAERLYKPEEAADLLGIDSVRKVKTLAEIPEALLPVTRVGAVGGLRRYYGRDLIAYIHRCRPAAAPKIRVA